LRWNWASLKKCGKMEMTIIAQPCDMTFSSHLLLASRYRIINKLGEGSFAETYLAEDQHLPDSYQCVVKKLKTGVDDESKLQIAKRLFDSEAKTLHQLGSHGQIPQLLAHFEEHGEFYLVEEYIEGTSLYHELATGQQWSEGYVLNLLQDVLEALRFVHQKGHIHRDIKPSNIIRRARDGKLVLIDFGAVKQVTNQVLDDQHNAAHTVIVGTPGYMPSEQLRGNPRMSSDVYAVGMLALYALTGLNPALGQLPEDEHTAEIIWRDRATVSPELANILDRMVAYDFRQRYPSAQEAIDAIHSLLLVRQNDTPTVVKTESTRGLEYTEVVAPAGSAAPHSPFDAPSQPPGIPFQSPGIGTDQQFSIPPQSPEAGSGAGTPSQLPVVINHLEFESSAGSVAPGASNGNGGSSAHIQPTVFTQGSSTNTQPTVFTQGSSAQQTVPQGSISPSTSTFSQVHEPSFANGQGNGRSPVKKFALIGGGIALALSAMVGISSPSIEPLCTVFKNCNADMKFKSQYTKALDQAKSAKQSSESATNLKDLEAAQVQLQDAVKDLEQIPDSVPVHNDAQRVLPEYQKALKDLNSRVATEKKGEQEFSKGVALIDQVTQEEQRLKDGNKTATVAILTEQEKKLKTAEAQMDKVPAKAMAAVQAKSKKQELKTRLTAKSQQIDKRYAIENPAPVYVPPVSSGGGSGGGGGNWRGGNGGWSSGSGSAAAPAPEPYNPPRARQEPVGGSGGGGGGGGSYNPPPPEPEPPLWGPGSGGGGGSEGGGGEPLWGN
jgi:serine/threonine protein kinase